jgi:hypothetical protein
MESMATKKTKKAASVRGAATAPAKKTAAASRGGRPAKKASKVAGAKKAGPTSRAAAKKMNPAKKAGGRTSAVKKAAATKRSVAKPARGKAAASTASKARSAKVASQAKPAAKRGAPARSAGSKPKGGLAKARPATPARKPAQHVTRRDGAGHLDPQYAAALMAESGLRTEEKEPAAFIESPRARDDLAENLGEEFVASATSGENQEEDLLDEQVPEERGGPFVETTGGTEFAEGTDASNPEDADREPFPTT